MTTRERWIVYPLLMFSLMMGIKTRYFQDTFMLKAEKIECGDLTVTLINGRPARLTAIIPNILPSKGRKQSNDVAATETTSDQTTKKANDQEAKDEQPSDQATSDATTDQSTDDAVSVDAATSDAETDGERNPPQDADATESNE